MRDPKARETATNASAPADPLRVLRLAYRLAAAQVVLIVACALFGAPWWLRDGLTLAVSLSWWRVAAWVMRGAR